MAELKISSEEIRDALAQFRDSYDPNATRSEVGAVVEAADGIARVSGLPSVMANELLEFPGGVLGVAQNLDEREIGAVVLGSFEQIKEGDEVRRTGEVLSIPVGDAFLGRVINPLGQPIDGKGPIESEAERPLELQAPTVLQRKPVSEPMQTGLKAIDAMTPIGRGQRQLIIGDRKTGKTSICTDTIINQKANWESGDPSKQVRCIYVAIGQKASTVASIRETLHQKGVLDKTIIVAATAADSAPLQYIAPMSGAAIGEYFMYNDVNGNPADENHPGGHVLVVYDDLSKQAVAYRQMSLTLHRPPGREAYPGDIFYLHSRLLERACKLSDARGAGSLTALPIIETQEGDVSAYIPTNVISITDGQIYLQSNLFFQGQRPAVDVGISVSRVGGAAQIKSMKQVAGTLRLDLASYREKQAFSQFGSDLDATTQYQLTHGAHMTEMLKQPRYHALDVADQVLTIYAAKEDFLDDIDLVHVPLFRDELAKFMKLEHDDIRQKVVAQKIDDELAAQIKAALTEFKEKFMLKHANKEVSVDVIEQAEYTAQAEEAEQSAEQE